jgi:hypothetical protein
MFADIEVTVAANGKKLSIQGPSIISIGESDNNQAVVFVKEMGALSTVESYDNVTAQAQPWPWLRGLFK